MLEKDVLRRLEPAALAPFFAGDRLQLLAGMGMMDVGFGILRQSGRGFHDDSDAFA